MNEDADSHSSDESESAELNEHVNERKVLPQRATRGVRKGKLLGTAAEADEEFWGQSAFKEDDSDEEFDESVNSSDSSETETDSDIDAPEPEEEGLQSGKTTLKGEYVVEDDIGGKKRGKGGKGYSDPALRASSAWSGSLGSIAAAAAASVAAAASRASRSSAADGGLTRLRGGDIFDSSTGLPQRVVRNSTQFRIGESGKPVIPAESKTLGLSAPPLPPKPTQTEVLTKAAHTAIENLRLLEGQLKIEQARTEREAAEAAAGRGKGHTFPPEVPIVRFHSRRGGADTITFTCVDAVPPLGVSDGCFPVKPRDARCEVTGKPAKYRDPLSGHFFYDVAAFKTIRAAYSFTETEKRAS